jgi:type II secretory pathway pseudopilin PulG
LVIVLAVLAMLSALVVPMVGNCVADSRSAVTRQNLTRLRDMIAETYWQDSDRCLPQRDTGVPPVPPGRMNTPQLRYLFVNPHTEDATVQYDPVYCRGWRGPYLADRGRVTYTINAGAGFLECYGENGDPTVLDGWDRPIVLQHPGTLSDGRQDVRLVSAGPDGVVSIPADKLTAELTAQDISDDVWASFELR